MLAVRRQVLPRLRHIEAGDAWTGTLNTSEAFQDHHGLQWVLNRGMGCPGLLVKDNPKPPKAMCAYLGWQILSLTGSTSSRRFIGRPESGRQTLCGQKLIKEIVGRHPCGRIAVMGVTHI